MSKSQVIGLLSYNISQVIALLNVTLIYKSITCSSLFYVHEP
jgi:hypothetical protein